MTAFASASTREIGKPVKDPIRNETTSEKKQKKIDNAEVKEDVKTVTCEASVGGMVYYQSYSCFFCWGGADSGCKAALLDKIIELNN